MPVSGDLPQLPPPLQNSPQALPAPALRGRAGAERPPCSSRPAPVFAATEGRRAGDAGSRRHSDSWKRPGMACAPRPPASLPPSFLSSLPARSSGPGRKESVERRGCSRADQGG